MPKTADNCLWAPSIHRLNTLTPRTKQMYLFPLWRTVAISCSLDLEQPACPPAPLRPAAHPVSEAAAPPPLSVAWWKWTFIPDNQPLLIIRVFTLWWRPNCRVICHYIVMESPNQKSLERDSRPPRTDASWMLRAIRDTLKITGCFNLLLHAQHFRLPLYPPFFSSSFFPETAAFVHPHLLISSVKSERLRTWGAARFPPFAQRLWSNTQTQQDEALWCWRQQQVAVNQRAWKRFGAQIFVPFSSSCCKTPIEDVWSLMGIDLPLLTLKRSGGQRLWWNSGLVCVTHVLMSLSAPSAVLLLPASLFCIGQHRCRAAGWDVLMSQALLVHHQLLSTLWSSYNIEFKNFMQY